VLSLAFVGWLLSRMTAEEAVGIAVLVGVAAALYGLRFLFGGASTAEDG